MFSSSRLVFSKAATAKALVPSSIRTYSSSGATGEINISIPPESFKTFKCEAPSLDVKIKKEDLLSMFKSMVAMRRMEMVVDGLYKAKLVRGFCHLCTGQEAVGVGMETALTGHDKVITAYRSHGFTFMRGGTLTSIIGELLGRKSGISGGKGGSMHMFTPNFFGGNGIVGAQVPIGAGIAFTQKYLGDKAATFVFYGDGAANQGQVFEAFNMAKLWNLPAVFVCENNQYGMGTSARRASANTAYYTRGDYIPGIRVNGMDVLAVNQAISYAKNWTISDEKGPLLLEMETYRYGGHSVSDPGTTYRSRDEIQGVRAEYDPISGLKEHLLENKIISEDEVKSLDKSARAMVDKAVEEAKASPQPDLEEFWTHIYKTGYEVPFLRGREPEEFHRYR